MAASSAPSAPSPLPASRSAPLPDPYHVLIATSLPSSLDAPCQARSVVGELLRRGRRPEMVDTACLLTSELVANAVVHAGSPVELVIDLDRARLAVEVIDRSAAPLRPTDADVLATGGRGLALVDRLADSWGVTKILPGKSVWFALTT
ncbi:ATP-binding protein [Iamia sp.]|uniref:ATP-binding protein n=1 Tax=Iamia sp. TaxID=2722710 RepID=UPI002C62CE4F|nr:ATP-binding protein [Iamia sp.]HXH57564.1 ATP-binding protein [Iamia sp.]